MSSRDQAQLDLYEDVFENVGILAQECGRLLVGYRVEDKPDEAPSQENQFAARKRFNVLAREIVEMGERIESLLEEANKDHRTLRVWNTSGLVLLKTLIDVLENNPKETITSHKAAEEERERDANRYKCSDMIMTTDEYQRLQGMPVPWPYDADNPPPRTFMRIPKIQWTYPDKDDEGA